MNNIQEQLKLLEEMKNQLGHVKSEQELKEELDEKERLKLKQLAEQEEQRKREIELENKRKEEEKQNLYDECRGCLNRICVTDDKTEVLTLLASLQTKAMILGKNTFLRIDEESNH